MARVLLFVTLVMALAVAGCTSTNNPSSGGNTTTSPSVDTSKITTSDALAMLKDAGTKMPQKYGIQLTLTSGSKQLLSLTGSLDNTTGSAYMEFKGDAAALGNASGSGSSEDQAMAQYLANGIIVYTTKDASLYLANGTAYVFPPSNDSSNSGFVPSPDKGPLGEFMNPAGTLTGLDKGNVSVKSVTPVTWKGQSAVRIVATTVENGTTVDATIVMYASPQRLAHVDTTLPKDPKNPSDPLGGASAAADFLYDNEVTTTPSPAATRALGLAYKSDHSGFSGSGQANITWTFFVSGGVSTSEIEAQVKDTSNATGSEGTDVSKLPTAWSMKLSDGTKTQDGVTIAFHDNDHDNKVSAGDTLTIVPSDPNAESPSVVLYDTVTHTYVVPGPGLALVGLALVGLALALRRRRG